MTGNISICEDDTNVDINERIIGGARKEDDCDDTLCRPQAEDRRGVIAATRPDGDMEGFTYPPLPAPGVILRPQE